MQILNFLNQLKEFYINETVLDLIDSKKQSIEYWNRIFPSAPLIKKISCEDIGPNTKQSFQIIPSSKRIAYMQVTFD
ncbi:unnamed protein product [Adineta steineri]|uniref:Uncharacterized protein n=1 Tax=Adineta steineri TaxID=433720 RepID=A0A815J044_9BILA|nr:unnamed protein product [Adineta steineri]CAF1605457.1 unnamed protein product [Adineta steineri]